MNTKLAFAAAGATALILILIPLNRAYRAEQPEATVQPPRSSAPAATGSAPARTAADAQRLLPFTPDQIVDAADLASRFAVAYTTHRYDEPPRTYLQRLIPMASPQLLPTIERAATDTGTLTQRHRTQEISTGQARPEVIRTLGPTSITFLLTVIDHSTTIHASRQDLLYYALTLAKTRDRWQVYAIELADTGNTGEPTAHPTP